MFERFTEKAIKTIMLAQEEARRLGHNFVGTEQMLLGVVAVGDGHTKNVFRAHKITLKDLRNEVEKIIGRGSGFVSVEIPFTPRAKRALETSWNVARELSVDYISVDHLLLGILHADEGRAVRALQGLGADPVQLRADMYSALGAPEPATLHENSWILDRAKTRLPEARVTLSSTAKYLASMARQVDRLLDNEEDPKAAASLREGADQLISELNAFQSDLERQVPEICKSIEQIKDRLRSQD